MRYQLLAALLIVVLVGCEPPKAQPGAPAPPDLTQTMGPTTVWNQTQVEAFLRQEIELTKIASKSTGGDNYQGTGTDAAGITYTLIVKQVPGGIKVEWTHDGDHGKITFGKPVP